jgi:hypothetical protein
VTARTVLSAALLATLLLAEPVRIRSWEWPWDGPLNILAGEPANGFLYRMRTNGGELRPVSPGEIVFAARSTVDDPVPTVGIPRSNDIVVLRHENQFLSGYSTSGLYEQRVGEAWNTREPPGALVQPAGSAAAGGQILTLYLWDATLEQQVNPRLILAPSEGLPDTQIPAVALYQEGIAVPLGEIAPGPVVVVIPRDNLDPTRLPWEVRLSHDGEVRSRHRFAYRSDVLAADAGDLGIELHRFDARPGVNTIVLEAVNFDWTVRQRTIRFTVEDSPPVSP